MGKILELSEDTYHQLAALAQEQQRPLDDMLRLCLLAYEAAQYQLAHQQMHAEGLLVSLVSPTLLAAADDFEPEDIAEQPLSEIILEEWR